MNYYKFMAWAIAGAIAGHVIARILIWNARRRRKHTHYCPCGNHWTHSELAMGNAEKHTCQDCGRQVWWVMR